MALEDILNVKRKPTKNQKIDSLLNIPLAKRIGLKLLQNSKVKRKSENAPTKTSETVPKTIADTEKNVSENVNNVKEDAIKADLPLPESGEVKNACHTEPAVQESKSQTDTLLKLEKEPTDSDTNDSRLVQPQENAKPAKEKQKRTKSRSSRRSVIFLPPPLKSEIVDSPSVNDPSISADSMEPPLLLPEDPVNVDNELTPPPVVMSVASPSEPVPLSSKSEKTGEVVTPTPINSNESTVGDKVVTPISDASGANDIGVNSGSLSLTEPAKVSNQNCIADQQYCETNSEAVLMEDILVDNDIQDFLQGDEEAAPPPKVVKKSRGRRKSADLLSRIEASAFVVSPDAIKADLPMKYTRRVRKQRRMSLELFRASQAVEKRLQSASTNERKSVKETQNLQIVQEESEEIYNDIKSTQCEITDATSLTKLKPCPTDNSRLEIIPSVAKTGDNTTILIADSMSEMSDARSNSFTSNDKLPSGDLISTKVVEVTPTNSFISEEESESYLISEELDSPQLLEPSPSPTTEESPRRSGRKRRIAQPPRKNAARPSRSRKRKAPKENVEDVYHNKLWRDQMPKEKAWETIFEEPKRKKTGEVNFLSAQRKRCFIKFDEFYNLNNSTRIQQRRKKAVRMGWRPQRKRESVGPNGEDEVDVLLQERISEWENENEITSTDSCDNTS